MGSSKVLRGVGGRSGFFALAIGILGLAVTTPARAAPVVWAGGSGDWTTATNWISGAAPTSSDVATFSGWAPLTRSDWVATASVTNSGDPTSNAIDGMITGRWSTGAGQTIGQWFKVDLGSVQTFGGLTVDAGTNTLDYPGGFDVFVSNDDVTYGSVVGSVTGASAAVSLSFTAQTARYIKLVMNTNANSAHWWSISEINVFGAAGPTQLSRSSWSATAALTDTTHVASSALDNVTSTYWRTGAAQIAPQWFKIDMQSAQTFTQLTIDAATDTNDYPHGYVVYAYNTDDGLHDGNAIAVGAGSAALTTVTFASQTARYIKVIQTSTFSAQWWSIHEINVLNGASTLSRSGWVASASLSTGTASSAIDGSTSTRWTTGTGQASWQWFKIDMQSAQSFAQLRLDDGSRNGEYPKAFAVYAYNTDDGLHEGNPVYTGTSAVDVKDLSFSTQTARYLKVLITGADAANWSIAELSVYGTPVGSAIQSSVTVAGVVLSNAVTITQGAGAAVTVTGSYAQSAGAFVGSNAAVAIQGAAFTLSGGTFTAGTGAVTIAGAATVSGGGIIDGGSSSGLTFGSTLAIGSGTAGTFNANAAIVTFSGAVTLQNGGAFNGNTGSGTFAVAPVLTSGTFTVANAGSGGRWTFNQSTTVGVGVTLAFPSNKGELSLAPATSLTVNGPVTSSVTSGATLPKIDCNGCSASQGITVAFGATSTLNIDGLELDNSVATGVSIADGATYTLLKRLAFKNNVANSISTGATHLSITSSNAGNAKILVIPGCSFDATAQYNVTLSGVSGSTGVRAIFENQSASTNGARAGASYDLDADTNGDNVADSMIANRYGAVVEWTYASPADTTGTAVGPPVAAFDFNTFGFYGVYASFTNINGAGTSDRLWMRNADGSAAYFYDVPDASGDIVGDPRFDTVNETTAGLDVNGDGDTLDTNLHVIYIGTSGGHIIKLIDSGTSLAPPASGRWATDFSVPGSVATITSPLISDGTNLYFGGTNGSAATSIFGVQISGGVNEKTVQKAIASAGAVTAAPSWATYNGSTYLFVGSAVSAGAAHVYRVQVSPGAVVETDFASSTANVNGGVNLVNARAYAVTDAGKLYVLDASNFNSGGFTTRAGFPYVSAAGSPIKAYPFVDGYVNDAYFGDNSGKLYVVTDVGANLTGYPYAIPGTPQLLSTPSYRHLSGTIAVGASDGYVYFVNRHADGVGNPAIRKRYFVGTGTVATVSYNWNSAQYMATTSDGRLTYINASDVGTDSDGFE